jgi:hypothetical protein
VRVFLCIKQWQLFLLFLGPLVVLMFMNIVGNLWGAIIVGLGLYLYLGWLWTIGSLYSSIIPISLRMRMNIFMFTLIYPAIEYPFFVLFGDQKSAMSGAITLIHMLAAFCIFYDIYFVSKSMVLAETGSPASFRNYAMQFFLVWFFPIGIWFIQPKVNSIMRGHPLTD